MHVKVESGKWVKLPRAYRVEIECFEFLELYAHKSVIGADGEKAVVDDGSWSVSEVKTGRSLSQNQESRKVAISAAETVLQELGVDKVRKHIGRF